MSNHISSIQSSLKFLMYLRSLLYCLGFFGKFNGGGGGGYMYFGVSIFAKRHDEESALFCA